MSEQVQSQVILPLSKAIQIAWRNIRVRWWRSLLVTSGIILALAFLMYVLAGDSLATNVAKVLPDRLSGARAGKAEALAGLRAAMAAASLEAPAPNEANADQLVALREDLERGRALGALDGAQRDRLAGELAATLAAWDRTSDKKERQATLDRLKQALTEAGVWDAGPLSAIRSDVTAGRFPRDQAASCRAALASLAPGFATADPARKEAVFEAADRAIAAAGLLEGYNRAYGSLRADGLLSGAGADEKTQTYWIVALALLVSFVGILNAMLMSVTERFAEIGTMKCLGALDGFIIKLFLLESTFQGVSGAVIGVLIGLVLSVIEGVFTFTVGRFGERVSVWSEIDIALGMIPWVRYLTVLAVCMTAGLILTIVAALYPAWRAAKMQPVEAMRAEV